MKARYIILFSILAVFFTLSAVQYNNLRKQQRNETAETIKESIILCGKNIENDINTFEESVKFEFASRELQAFFDPELQKLELEAYNDYISNDIKRIRRFYSQNQEIINKITIYNDSTYRTFDRSTNNYFTVSLPEANTGNLKLYDSPVFSEVGQNYQYIQPITNSNGDLIANACLDLNINEFISTRLNEFYIGRNSWSWAIRNDEIILNNYSEPSGEQAFNTDILDLFNQKLEENLTTSVQHTITYGETVNAHSVFYPVTLIGKRFGIVFSVNTDTLFQQQNKASVNLFIYILIAIISIILLFTIILKQKNIATKKLETTGDSLKQANKASEILLTDPDLSSSMNNFFEIVSRELGYHRAFLMEISPNEKESSGKLVYEWKETGIQKSIAELIPEIKKGITMPDYQDFLSGFKQNQFLKFNINSANPVFASLLSKIQGKAIVNIPVYVNEDLYGILAFADCKQERNWQNYDDVFFANLANAVGGALANHQAKSELTKAKEEAEKANSAKSEFLSRMSHELRTPLNSILGFGQLLELGDLTPRQQNGVNHIMKSGNHLLDLINEVLNISRIESGRIKLSIEPVSVRDIIREMIDIVTPHAQKRNISIDLKYSCSDQISIQTDRQRFKQILLNLINNAIKYNRENGSIIIHIDIPSNQTKQGTPVRISITDTGYGIKPEYQEKLFVPFERIGAEKTNTEGTGLGLSVVKELVKALNGELGLESAVDEGSTFWIELPLAKMQQQQIDAHNNTSSPKNGYDQQKEGVVLYIEDNNPNIDLVKEIISTHRPSFRLITNMLGGQALNLAKIHKPDVILLDLHLPDMHGEDVLTRLKTDEATKNIPVVIITADAMSSKPEKLLEKGAHSYLTKPIEVISFLNILDKSMQSVLSWAQ